MKGDGELRQALEKPLVGWRCGTPEVLEDFVSLKEVPPIEERYSFPQVVTEHARFCHGRGPREAQVFTQFRVETRLAAEACCLTHH